jgi:hypothetical protein
MVNLKQKSSIPVMIFNLPSQSSQICVLETNSTQTYNPFFKSLNPSIELQVSFYRLLKQGRSLQYSLRVREALILHYKSSRQIRLLSRRLRLWFACANFPKSFHLTGPNSRAREPLIRLREFSREFLTFHS